MAALAGMLVGQRVDLDGVRWSIVQPIKSTDAGAMLYLAVRHDDVPPAVVHLISVPKGTDFVR